MKHLLMIHLLFWAGLAHGDEKKNQFKVAGKTFEAPITWKVEKPSSRMRKAQYKSGKTEIVVFYSEPVREEASKRTRQDGSLSSKNQKINCPQKWKRWKLKRVRSRLFRQEAHT
jgi:hypothetical protein